MRKWQRVTVCVYFSLEIYVKLHLPDPHKIWQKYSLCVQGSHRLVGWCVLFFFNIF